MVMVCVMHILYVGEDVREDGHCEKFVHKVIPQNSIRLLNVIGEGMYMYININVMPVYSINPHECALCISYKPFLWLWLP